MDRPDRPTVADSRADRQAHGSAVVETIDDALDRVAEAFHAGGLGLREHSRGHYTGFCPICGGGSSGKPSLKVAVGRSGTTVAVACYRCGISGTDWNITLASILAAVDLTIRDLYPKGASRGPVDSRLNSLLIARWAQAALESVTTRGRAGDSCRRVILALAQIAADVGEIEFTASERQIAERAGVSRVTVHRVLWGRRNRRGQAKTDGLGWVFGKPEERWVERVRPSVTKWDDNRHLHGVAATLRLIPQVTAVHGLIDIEEPIEERPIARMGSVVSIFVSAQPKVTHPGGF